MGVCNSCVITVVVIILSLFKYMHDVNTLTGTIKNTFLLFSYDQKDSE